MSELKKLYISRQNKSYLLYNSDPWSALKRDLNETYSTRAIRLGDFIEGGGYLWRIVHYMKVPNKYYRTQNVIKPGVILQMASVLSTIRQFGPSNKWNELDQSTNDNVAGYLNTTFFQGLPKEMRDVISPAYINTSNGDGTDSRQSFKVWLPSAEELSGVPDASIKEGELWGYYANYIPTPTDSMTPSRRIFNAKGNNLGGTYCGFFTRTPGASGSIKYVSSRGDIEHLSPESSGGVCPCILILA